MSSETVYYYPDDPNPLARMLGEVLKKLDELTARIDQLTYPDGVDASEVLKDLTRVRYVDDDGNVVWRGRSEGPKE